MLNVEKLSYSYEAVRALHNVSLEVKEGTITALLGSNGAGKSTLLNVLSGIYQPDEGSIHFKGKDITGYSAFERVEEGMSLVPERRRLFSTMTVLENLKAGAYSRKARGKFEDNLKRVYGLFPTLKERRKQLASTMSGGEQQMVAMARGLMSEPSLLLLDEPLLGLQPSIIPKIIEKLKEVSQEGVTILLVEQNIRQVLNFMDWGYVLESGQITIEGSAKTLEHDDRVRKAYLGL